MPMGKKKVQAAAMQWEDINDDWNFDDVAEKE